MSKPLDRVKSALANLFADHLKSPRVVNESARHQKGRVKRKREPTKKSRTRGATISTAPHEPEFREVLALIEGARERAFHAVNTELIDLYWRVGGAISRRIAANGWGKSTIASLAYYIRSAQPNLRGFSSQNLWRMRQFFDTYDGYSKLSALLRELSWTCNLLILGRCKTPEEREFYLRLATREKWPSRQLDRQLKARVFERAVLNPPKLSAALRESRPEATEVFKDCYIVEFLQLSAAHSEADLHLGLVARLKDFLSELGRDFCFVGSEYPVQVGGRDFSIDLLFFNRALNSLVAFELKVDEFQPEHLGKLEFYLEALDRDVRKPHEHPSIGVLLCATKDTEVVEYALARALSPALIAEYKTRLPNAALLKRKLHEFYQLALTSSQRATAPRSRKNRP
jgi:predicted nuclease of restriction endonuclease-like (RecB) superfamily